MSKATVVVTRPLVEKLDTMAYDLKVYVNMNAAIGERSPGGFKMMSVEEAQDLINLRKEIKEMSSKLKKYFKDY